MPNGISCAYFAALNHENGLKHDNIFREGVAVAQTARTIDAITASQTVACSPMLNGVLSPIKPVFSKLAALSRKIIYPLFIMSTALTTLKSKDKVKTGISQSTGLICMSLMENMEVKGIKKLEKLISKKVNLSNKYLRYGWYILKGLCFITASMGGYTMGNKVAGKAVDIARKLFKKQDNKENLEQTSNTDLTDKIDEEIFSEMDDYINSKEA